jgi:hypothetical protein
MRAGASVSGSMITSMSLSHQVPYSFSLHSVIIDSGNWKLSQMAAHISSKHARLLADKTVLQKYDSNASVNQLATLCICQNINCSWNYFLFLFLASSFGVKMLHLQVACEDIWTTKSRIISNISLKQCITKLTEGHYFTWQTTSKVTKGVARVGRQQNDCQFLKLSVKSVVHAS